MCAPHIIRHVGNQLAAQKPYLAPADHSGGAASGTTERNNARAPFSSAFQHIVDLTHPLSPDFPIFPAFQPMKVQTTVTMEKDGFYARRWDIDEHTGTHLDAPAHFAVGDGIRTMDQIPATQLVVPMVVIDIKERADKDFDTVLTVDDVLAYERRHGRIPDGAAVCVYTGWETRVGSAQEFLNPDASGVMHFPGIGVEAARFLAEERNVAGVGIDTLSLDFGPSTDFRAHFEILSRNKWGLEALANLNKVPPAGALLMVGALKVREASGGPCRVLAIW